MKLRLLTTALLMLATPAVLSARETVTERFDRVYDFQPGTRLVVSNENGSVTVRTWDKTAVHVVAEKRARAGSEERARDVLREVKIDVRADGRTLVVETESPDDGMGGFFSWLEGKHADVDVSYEITVPKSLPLKVGTVNGRIDVAGINGEIDLSTTNGRIDVADAGGSLIAETTNGGIHAVLTQVAPGSKLQLETTNGAIDLAVPSSIRADLRAETTNGSIHSDFPVLTQHGDSNSLEGSINGGGPELKLETTNGSIRVRKSD